MKDESQTYSYTFLFPDGHKKTFNIKLNADSQLINKIVEHPPSWTKLEHHQCTPCPLTVLKHPLCPAAFAISSLVSGFKGTRSYSSCVVECTSFARKVTKETSVQDGLASILGLLLATSGCPIMDFFKPLARFHLPFSTVDETIFRVFATYMLKQYYLHNKGQAGDFTLHKIKKHYKLVNLVNKGILARIGDIAEHDADQNAIVTLNSLAQILDMEIDTNLESLQHLFDGGTLF